MNDLILKAVLSNLTARRDSLMVDINIMTSATTSADGLVSNLTEKILQLSIVESAIEQTQSFIVQALGAKVANFTSEKKE